MITYQLPPGKLRLMTITGTNDILFLALRPDEGTFWKVISARARTDEPASGHVGAWEFGDDTLLIPISATAGLGAAVCVYLYTFNVAGILIQSLMEPPWITHSAYLQFRVNAIDAGKKLFIDAIVEQVVGFEARVNSH